MKHDLDSFKKELERILDDLKELTDKDDRTYENQIVRFYINGRELRNVVSMKVDECEHEDDLFLLTLTFLDFKSLKFLHDQIGIYNKVTMSVFEDNDLSFQTVYVIVAKGKVSADLFFQEYYVKEL